jgi:hypothetical protein
VCRDDVPAAGKTEAAGVSRAQATDMLSEAGSLSFEAGSLSFEGFTTSSLEQYPESLLSLPSKAAKINRTSSNNVIAYIRASPAKIQRSLFTLVLRDTPSVPKL